MGGGKTIPLWESESWSQEGYTVVTGNPNDGNNKIRNDDGLDQLTTKASKTKAYSDI